MVKMEIHGGFHFILIRSLLENSRPTLVLCHHNSMITVPLVWKKVNIELAGHHIKKKTLQPNLAGHGEGFSEHTRLAYHSDCIISFRGNSLNRIRVLHPFTKKYCKE